MPNTRSLLVAVVLLMIGGGPTYAQQSDIEQVKATIDAYHAAIGSRDFAKLEPLLAHDANVMLINPVDKSISVGWDAVKKDWESAFSGNPAKFTITQAEGPHIVVNGNVAWSIGRVGVTTQAATQPGVFETDVFEKRGGKWLLVSHTALRVPQ